MPKTGPLYFLAYLFSKKVILKYAELYEVVIIREDYCDGFVISEYYLSEDDFLEYQNQCRIITFLSIITRDSLTLEETQHHLKYANDSHWQQCLLDDYNDGLPVHFDEIYKTPLEFMNRILTKITQGITAFSCNECGDNNAYDDEVWHCLDCYQIGNGKNDLPTQCYEICDDCLMNEDKGYHHTQYPSHQLSKGQLMNIIDKQ
jgi:hypothetical protein